MRERLRRFLALAFVSALLPSASLHALTWVEVAQFTHAGFDTGWSVAIDGDVAVISDLTAPRVFVRSGGIWAEAADLVPSAVATPHEFFGWSVAIRGDTIAVGSPCDFGTNCGHIYVFVRPKGGWSGTLNENARLGVFGQIRLGEVVAFAGDSIVTVASDNPAAPNGLYVFNKPGSGWSGTVAPSAILLCSLNGFLVDVAGSGDVIVAGSPLENHDNLQQAGKAFVWVKPAGGWSGFISNAAELLPSDPIENGGFGQSVGIDGTTVVVPSTYEFAPPTPNHSKGYVFEMPSAGWTGTLTENAQLVGSDVVNADSFGLVTSISGDTVVIGAIQWPGFLSHLPLVGAAYVFDRPASGWSGTVSETTQFTGSQDNDVFGNSVAISGGTIVVGSPQETVGGNLYQGVAHVFELRKVPFVTLTRWFVKGPIRVPPGVPVEFRVQVEIPEPASVEPTGVVVVGGGRTGQECRAVLDPSGAGSCALTFPRVGTYPIRAHYLGGAEFKESTSPALAVLVGRQ